MNKINAAGLVGREINIRLGAKEGEWRIEDCCGQRFIGAGMSGRSIEIEGVPGNALGAYLDGGSITVWDNAQDAVGDTMNGGRIVIHGSVGDTAGYAMRGGEIYVRGNAGYRAGIHMKAYENRIPALIIGGSAGSFLGEYQAGGHIVVLGLGLEKNRQPVGDFACTGMHGGKLYLRGNCAELHFPRQVEVRPAVQADIDEIRPQIERFSTLFGYAAREILDAPFTVVQPDSSTPYKQMYVAN